MAHERQAIREKIKALLLAASTDAGTNVFINRTIPVGENNLPAIIMYSDDEQNEDRTVVGRQQKRLYTIITEVVVETQTGEQVENERDDIAKQIENVINGNRKLDGLVFDSLLNRTKFGFTNEGKKPTGAAILFWDIRYTI